MRPVVFVSGPLRSDRPSQVGANVLTAQEAVLMLVQLGCAPFCPHTALGWSLGRMDELHAASVNRTFLQLSDAVYVLPGWASSRGTIVELAHAQRAGKPMLASPQEVSAWLMTRTRR